MFESAIPSCDIDEPSRVVVKGVTALEFLDNVLGGLQRDDERIGVCNKKCTQRKFYALCARSAKKTEKIKV
jgi:hypothetical protein